MATRPPVMLVILDGWGWREDAADNAVAQARTPAFDALWAQCPHAFLRTSGADVGLPDGQMGNSEVGHLNIGAGRVVMQDLPRIGAAIADGSIAALPALTGLIAALKRTGGTCHLMGLLSPGGVHAHQDHAVALARILSGHGIPVAIHVWTDGRDTRPAGRPRLHRALRSGHRRPARRAHRDAHGALLRDGPRQSLDRVSQAYDVMVCAAGARAPTAAAAIKAAHAAGRTDEFIPATAIGDYAGMQDGDGLLCFNFRADRVREILAALVDPAFAGFPRATTIRFAAAAGMTEYSAALNPHLATLFAPQSMADILGPRSPPPACASCAWRDGKIPTRHLLPERRRGDALSRRGPHHGPLPPRSRPMTCSPRCRPPNSPTRPSPPSRRAPTT